jgi:hypothetical protein
MKKTTFLLSSLITSFALISSTNLAIASPFIRADFVSESRSNTQAKFSYIDLGTVAKVNNRTYKYVRTITPADFVGEYVESERNLAKRKLIESEVVVQCNDVNSLQIQKNRYYKNGRLIKTENANKTIRHTESNPLREGNLIVCRFFDSASSQALKPGFYLLGSKGIQISIKGNRICYEGTSRNGRTVSSVSRDPKYLSLYRLQSVGKQGQSNKPLYLIQLTSNAIHYGDFISLYSLQSYDDENNTNSKEMNQCLNSNKPYSFFEE